LTYDRYDNDANFDSAINEWNLGVGYDFEVAKVSLGFGQTRNGLMQVQAPGAGVSFSTDDSIGVLENIDGLKVNSYLVGVSAPIGNGKILASWQMADATNSGNLGWDAKKQQVYSLGYTYNLSKRTNLYAIGSYGKNMYFADDVKSTAIGVGIRHMF